MSLSTALTSTANTESLENVTTTNENHNKQYLCLVCVITAGLLDDDLGSDEQEIIEMIHLILDVDQKKVCLLNYFLIKIVQNNNFSVLNRL